MTYCHAAALATIVFFRRARARRRGPAAGTLQQPLSPLQQPGELVSRVSTVLAAAPHAGAPQRRMSWLSVSMASAPPLSPPAPAAPSPVSAAMPAASPSAVPPSAGARACATFSCWAARSLLHASMSASMSARVKNSSRDSSRPRPRPAVRPALRPTLRLAPPRPAVRAAPRPAARALTRPGATPATRPGATSEALRPPRMTVRAIPAAGRPPRTTVGATPAARRPPRTVGAAALLRMAPRTLPRELATESGRSARPRPPPADLETSRAGARPVECSALVLGRLFPSKRSESVIFTPAAPRPECTTTARPRPAESVPPRPESVGRCRIVGCTIQLRVPSPGRRASIMFGESGLCFIRLQRCWGADFELASRRAAN